ncbi:hypothetical protein GGR51DRAFT_574035 [Nemania sp. FL0031]|nr:hypothetical protein GGR51DRAFT_574035 [Nemania sp. FL0031]
MWLAFRSLNFIIKSRQDEDEEIYTTPQDNINGSFIYPRTYPLTFTEKTAINVTWNTRFESVNLYYYQSGNVANSSQLARSLRSSWFYWEVSAVGNDYALPYVFRIVNSHGTDYERYVQGFWSTSFYIVGKTLPALTMSTPGTPSSTLLSTTCLSTSASSAILTTSTSLSTTCLSEFFSSTLSSIAGEQTSAAPGNRLPNSGITKLQSPGVLTGIIIGAFLGGIGLAVGAIWYRGRKKRAGGPRAQAPKVGSGIYPQTAIMAPRELYCPPPELEGVRMYHEMPPNES